ncbi:dnaJ homolog subfamily C member 1-like [Physella acuta]|uniref:dnaJ homolog subfamily C member 1-like n=1 Tax=Physella acuta TaxID=109671 RepID=UPI0027DC07C2|nr:dnaJ homolog subfamily C member 1-like [Physella acuta]
MASTERNVLVSLGYLFLFAISLSHGWESEDFELFDLVEEININFYEYFEIDQSASSSDVRKAYRRLSLQYHPDKNSAEDASEKFRQIVAVYEVLKDEKKRQRYNQILVEGLPDWRQPVYYYRRARKMGIYELVVLLCIIITIGQYFVSWGIYVEKRLVMEEIVTSKKKKEKKKKKHTSADEDIPDDEELNSLPTPRILDLWPFQLSIYLFYTLINLPETIRHWKEERKRRKEEEEAAKAFIEEETTTEVVRKPKKRSPLELPEYTSEMYAKLSVTVPGENKKETQGSNHDKKDTDVQKKGEWSDEDLILLSKAVNKFPGGTHQRWEKIAEMVGRSVQEVTLKAKETKGNYSMHLSTAVQNSVPSLNNAISDYIITQNEDGEDIVLFPDGNNESQVRKRQRPTKLVKTPERTLLIAQGTTSTSEGTKLADVQPDKIWTQNQQTIFEWALKQFPKGTEARWEKVAEHIPGKSKEDCIRRFKELAELVSRKKKGEQ